MPWDANGNWIDNTQPGMAQTQTVGGGWGNTPAPAGHSTPFDARTLTPDQHAQWLTLSPQQRVAITQMGAIPAGVDLTQLGGGGGMSQGGVPAPFGGYGGGQPSGGGSSSGGGFSGNPMDRNAIISWVQNQHGVDPSAQNDPGYWADQIIAHGGATSDNLGYFGGRIMNGSPGGGGGGRWILWVQ